MVASTRLAWKIAQSPLVKKVYCAPGNAGTANVAENIKIPADNVNALLQFAISNRNRSYGCGA